MPKTRTKTPPPPDAGVIDDPSLKRIREASDKADRLRLAWDEAKEEASSAKKAWEAAVEEMQDTIRTETTPAPLFDPAAADNGDAAGEEES
jgi:hypothetical protein